MERAKAERFPPGQGNADKRDIEREVLLGAESALRSALFASPDPPPPEKAVSDYLATARREAAAVARHLLAMPPRSPE